MTQGTGTDWSKAPIVVLIGLIASCIAIFAFITGKQSVPEIFSTSTSQPIIYSAPVSTASPTETKVPTIVPSPVSTPTNSFPVLDGSPSNWLPNSDDIPSEMRYGESNSVSNEEVAKQYDNPTEMFSKLEEWGRLTGYFQQYLHKDGCNSKTGLREIILQAVIYKTATGAQQALDWFASRNGQPETTTIAGESGYIFLSTDKSTCEPPDNLKYVGIGFRRYNVLGFVDVGSVAGTMSDTDMEALATRLAQLIDLRFVAEAKQP